MGFFRRIGGILGILKDEGHEGGEEEDEEDHRGAARGSPPPRRPPNARGFSVQVPVAVERPASHGPLLVPCDPGEGGGVQGLRWHARRLKIDEDGDVADEFLDEILPEVTEPRNQATVPRFGIKHTAQPVAVRKQIIDRDGNFRQGVEHRGRLQWV